MLQRRDAMPHFDLMTLGGERFRYASIWQRRNLVLVVVPAGESAAAPRPYVAALLARTSEFTSRDAECVVTADAVPGVQSPAVVIADKWGEIDHVATAAQVEDLPSPDELLDWIDYLDRRCPECEGEAK